MRSPRSGPSTAPTSRPSPHTSPAAAPSPSRSPTLRRRRSSRRRLAADVRSAPRHPRAWLFGIARRVYAHHCEQASNGRRVVVALAGRRPLADDELEELAARIDDQRAGVELLAAASGCQPSSGALSSSSIWPAWPRVRRRPPWASPRARSASGWRGPANDSAPKGNRHDRLRRSAVVRSRPRARRPDAGLPHAIGALATSCRIGWHRTPRTPSAARAGASGAPRFCRAPRWPRPAPRRPRCWPSRPPAPRRRSR